MKRSRFIIAAFLLTMGQHISAQGLHTGYFTDDYSYRHEDNPAFANDRNYVSLPGLGNINVTTMGNFGLKDVVRDNPLYPSQSDKKKTSFLNPYLSDPLKGFSKGNNSVGSEVSIAVLGAGFKAFGGYNTITVNLRADVNAKVPYELLRFAVNAGNGVYDIGDISADAQSWAELALGHSRQINEQWRVGAKLKFLFGLGNASARMEDVKAQLEGDTWRVQAQAHTDVSVKGFQYKSEAKEYEASDGTYQRVNDVDVDGYGLSGFGLATDLGAVYTPNDTWQFSAAIKDLGFIHWSNDCYAENPSPSFTFDGFHDMDVKGSQPNTMDKQGDRYSDQLSQFANLQDKGDKGGRTTGLGMTINVGASYTLPAYKKMKIGMLSSTRFISKYTRTEVRASANWMPLRWLDGCVSLAGGTYGFDCGWLLNIHPAGVNFFIGMDHIPGKFSKEFIPLSSNASLTMGLSVSF